MYNVLLQTIFVKSSVVDNSLHERFRHDNKGREDENLKRVSLLQERSSSYK